jgi:hypothetical protein
MCLCMLVVMQDTSRISLYDAPIMHYLAVRGVDEQAKAFRAAFFYTPILAAMLWINRLIMLEVAVPLEAWPALGLKSKTDVESVRDRIHELRQKHLCEGSFSPTASILSQLAMGKHFNQLHQSQPNIHWSEDEQIIYYIGEPVELGKIKSMCRTLVQELQEALEELTFGSVPSIDLGGIVDSMAWAQAFRRENYSFREHVANKEHTGVGYPYLYKRARKAKGRWKLLKKSRSGTQRMEWVDGQVRKYLTKERQFLRKLMVCMHVAGKLTIVKMPEVGVQTITGVYRIYRIYRIYSITAFTELTSCRWPASPGTRNRVHQDQQQCIFRPEHICHQWTYGVFNHVRQITEATWEYGLHRTMFARPVESGVGPVFGVRESIRPRVAIGSTRVGVFVWGRARAMGRRGIEPDVEPDNKQAFGRAVDSIIMAARGHWHCHPTFDASQSYMGEG